MPVLAQASIYHEEKNLHASDLKRWEDHSNKEISWRSMSQVYKITAQNRLSVMAALMFVFNQQLSQIQKSSLYDLCKISSKLVSQGFLKLGHSYRPSYGSDPLTSSTTSTSSAPKQSPRIPLAQPFLVELLHAIYFAMFNEFASAAIQAVDDIHNRACYELYPDVILVTNAIKNSLQANPSGKLKWPLKKVQFDYWLPWTGQPSDGPMGISVALTPATTVVTVSKSMITNASFRTKKLPGESNSLSTQLIPLSTFLFLTTVVLNFVIVDMTRANLRSITYNVTQKFKGWILSFEFGEILKVSRNLLRNLNF